MEKEDNKDKGKSLLLPPFGSDNTGSADGFAFDFDVGSYFPEKDIKEKKDVRENEKKPDSS